MSKTIIFRLKRVRCTVVLFITSQCQPGTVPFFITRFAAESTLMSSFFYACFLRRSPHLLQIADVSLLYLHEVVTQRPGRKRKTLRWSLDPLSSCFLLISFRFVHASGEVSGGRWQLTLGAHSSLPSVANSSDPSWKLICSDKPIQHCMIPLRTICRRVKLCNL